MSPKAVTSSGHCYRVEAWGKHIRSTSPVEFFLGVDLGGAEDWPWPPLVSLATRNSKGTHRATWVLIAF
jgi:hypothetical protein